MTEVQPHVRYCHGCDSHDDAPRTRVIVDLNDASRDELFHHDCLPDEHAATQPADLRKHVKAGLKGDKLRAAIAKSVATSVGA